MRHLYLAYGRTIASNINLDLPSVQNGEVDLTVEFTETPTSATVGGELEITEDQAHWTIEVDDVQHFEAKLSDDLNRLMIRYSTQLGRQAVTEAFAHPLLARVLRVQGVPGLHASVVSWEGQGLALLGPSGEGKSTLARELCRLGAELLADDLAVVERQGNEWVVHRGSAGLRLEAGPDREVDSRLFALSGLDQPDSPRKYQAFPLGDRARAPIAALVVLGSGVELRLQRIADPKQALFELMRHRFGSSLLTNEAREREFKLMASLVRERPVFRLIRPRDPKLMSEQSELIRKLLARPSQ